MHKVVVILLVVHIHYGISFLHAISDMKHIRRFGAHTQLNAVNKKVDKYKPQQSLDPSASKATKTSVAKQYQYVQGGFNEVRAPKSSDNSTTTMYAAFDSALRASSYNMFCSPLLPVEPPTPFKKKKSEQKFDVKSATVDEYQERAREEAGQILKQYQELDRYLSSTGPTKKIKGNKESEISSVSTQSDMREWLDAAQSPSSIVDEDYEQLESLLGFERIGATSQMNSGTFKGNMSKHRAVWNFFFPLLLTCFLTTLPQEGKFRAKTIKGPLPRRSMAPSRKDQQKSSVGNLGGNVTAQGLPIDPTARHADNPQRKSEAAEQNFVQDFLSTIHEQSPHESDAPRLSKPARRARPPPPRSADPIPSGEPTPPPPPRPRREVAESAGRVVMNHSTHIPGLIAALQRLAATKGVATVVPGRLYTAGGRQASRRSQSVFLYPYFVYPYFQYPCFIYPYFIYPYFIYPYFIYRWSPGGFTRRAGGRRASHNAHLLHPLEQNGGFRIEGFWRSLRRRIRS
jgi:hypothetical protein